MTRKQQIIIIAGPNGAGKTTFARQFLPQEGLPRFHQRGPDRGRTVAFPSASRCNPRGEARVVGNR
jgi:hypothetical protein